jgi:hypothetical protein
VETNLKQRTTYIFRSFSDPVLFFGGMIKIY